ncbi:MAG: phosphomannomutase/phosphoglucomutase [Candidatus Obscuribacter sp.]|nr:phosphomannomutase/phosphoglucomutase [Candidatus Obscuribacter sp.]MBK9774065.1 phosphomannomutase/phosphoglucomutase [Candidatus Obscuribacter sp.]
MSGCNGKLFGAYDIRGVYGEGLDEAFARKVGNAYGHYLRPNGGGRVLVGYDARLSSPSLKTAFIEGVLASGNDVVDIGISSTPMAVWFAAHHDFDGGAAITASHLAKHHNGFKLYAAKAKPLGAKNGLGEIRKVVEATSLDSATTSTKASDTTISGKLSQEEIVPMYVKHLIAHLKPERRLKIAIDAGHGAAGGEITELARQAKDLVDIITLNAVPDGNFPTRTPNPLDPGCMDELIRVVKTEGCDFGVSLDGDADRAVFVDELGQVVPTDLMIGLIGAELIKRAGGGSVVYDLRASRAVPEYIEEAGGKAIRTGVGTNFMMSSIKDNNALFAGELSGHYYYGDMFATDNALRTILEALNVVSSMKTNLSTLIKPLSRYALSGEINLRVNEIQSTLNRLEASVTGGTNEHIDGLSINFNEWWFAARGSQTEPVLRLTVGAVSEQILQDRTKHLIEIIQPTQV